MNFDVDRATIFLTVHGSHAYGTNIETSDVDVKGVCVPPYSYIMGYAYHFEQMESHSPQDKVVYGIQKFFALAADCNPNIIEVLHTDPSSYLKVTRLGELLLEHKDLFLSRKARHTFSGYARAQLKRIMTHRSWLLSPPKEKPKRTDYGLPDEDSKVINASSMGAIDALQQEGYEFSGSIMSAIQKEKQYATALQQWKQYCSWKEARNKDRALLEAKYGYDCKHGMHLLRLMRMCVEILSGEGVKVRRPDAPELLEVRNGLWSYERLLEEANRLDTLAESLYATSPLPKLPPIAELNDLCASIVEASFLEDAKR